ncbi:molybdenum cofactor biosynthesis protein MoaE [Synechococcus sp. CS-1328]|uniref:molybdenum cofactor biosynthesis protein MoaE n=1 Tax=Synechococcus sp. CS-1328 TaxID=2847976 RepID=UPI0037DA3726
MADPSSPLRESSTTLSIALEAWPFDPFAVLRPWSTGSAAAAEAHFIGRVRGWSAAGEPLAALELEHYPGMTEAQLERLAAAAAARHAVRAVLVRHRVGRVQPGEAIVLVAVAADRRGPAQRCCQELLEALKHDAPFWKKEVGVAGQGRWVDGNTPLEEPAPPGQGTQTIRTA